MGHGQVGATEVVGFLNKLVELDREAVEDLFLTSFRMKNLDLCKLMPVQEHKAGPRLVRKMSVLGILNGIFANGDGNYPIGMDLLNGRLVCFRDMSKVCNVSQPGKTSKGRGK
jgi:hypothetical protein